MSLGTPEPKEAIHSPNEKWELVLSEGNFNAMEQKGDNTQTNSLCWIFQSIAHCFLATKSQRVIELAIHTFSRRDNPHSDFRVLHTAGKAETNTNHYYCTPATNSCEFSSAQSSHTHSAALRAAPYLRRLSFFSSLVKQLSRCLFIYCSRIATSQTGHSTESKGEGIHWCGYNSKKPMFSSEKLTVGTVTKHTSPQLLLYWMLHLSSQNRKKEH